MFSGNPSEKRKKSEERISEQPCWDQLERMDTRTDEHSVNKAVSPIMVVIVRSRFIT
jgi:hypothetical protein